MTPINNWKILLSCVYHELHQLLLQTKQALTAEKLEDSVLPVLFRQLGLNKRPGCSSEFNSGPFSRDSVGAAY